LIVWYYRYCILTYKSRNKLSNHLIEIELQKPAFALRVAQPRARDGDSVDPLPKATSLALGGARRAQSRSVQMPERGLGSHTLCVLSAAGALSCVCVHELDLEMQQQAEVKVRSPARHILPAAKSCSHTFVFAYLSSRQQHTHTHTPLTPFCAPRVQTPRARQVKYLRQTRLPNNKYYAAY
jgi:hypothetical protein